MQLCTVTVQMLNASESYLFYRNKYNTVFLKYILYWQILMEPEASTITAK